ncbi:hypothetical protein ABVK25_005372 [Lepraria finkii]|uniref:Uncharacterized protein n=1 Tax=Lepraria finkii TaxID=1340010 RepID=A0ABR4BB28_9LECA
MQRDCALDPPPPDRPGEESKGRPRVAEYKKKAQFRPNDKVFVTQEGQRGQEGPFIVAFNPTTESSTLVQLDGVTKVYNGVAVAHTKLTLVT